MAVMIDTLAYARRLRDAGVAEREAEAHAEALAAAMTDSIATKQDLRELDSRLALRFEHVDARFERIEERFERIEERFERIDERFARMDERFAALEQHVDTRLEEFEKRMDLRFREQDRFWDSRFAAGLADLERRMTTRLGGMMAAGIAIIAALIRIS